MINKFLKITLLLISFFSILSGISFADFSLSVRPYEGGYDLDFGKFNFATPVSSKEIIVDVRSDLGKQYRVIQVLFESLTSAQGNRLSNFNNFTVYSLRGSNRLGTISVDQETPVSLSRNIIYTSNSQGESDSFTLVYNIKGPLNVPAGSYRGRIGFTIESVDGVQNPVTVYLNVLVQVDAQSLINVSTDDASKTIRINSDPEKIKNSQVTFNIDGALGGQYKIYQVFSNDFNSNEGNQLLLSSINYSVTLKSGSGKNNEVLSNNQQTIYTSDLSGSSDSFVVNYDLVKDAVTKVGLYRNNVKYLLESPANSGNYQVIAQFALEVNIEKIFDLEFNTDLGTNMVMFRGIKPNDPQRKYEVEVKIKSNLGRMYQVTQKVLAPLSTKDGQIIDPKYFTVFTDVLAETKGTLKITNKQPVEKNDTVLFISDKKGSEDNFKAVYELSVPWDVKSGDYSSSIVYSLSEL